MVSGRKAVKWSTETMSEFVVGYTELDGSKLKKGNGFLKPNFGGGAEPLRAN